MYNILIADDEKEIIRLLRMYLSADDVTVHEAFDGLQAMNILNGNNIDLALVDIMMPKVDGYRLIKHIRQQPGYIPVIVISAKVTLSDRVLGMDIGADDYITKPFEPLEVAAKVRAQLRRLSSASRESAADHSGRVITAGDITLNTDEYSVTKNGEPVDLTLVEFKILELLIGSPKRVFTKEQIYENAWYSDSAVDDNTIRVLISRLRDKIGGDHIRTIRGLGYRFEA